LLISLYAAYKEEADATLPREENGGENKRITSYHEVMDWAGGPYWGNFSKVMVILALGGLSTVQIVSTSSNLYLLDLGVEKRTLSCIVGAVMSLACFIPTYREYRVFSFLGLVATSYTAWYMVTESVIVGPAPDVVYKGPTSLKMFFTCFSSLVFMFGTHSAAIEKADVMNKPSRYDIAYVFAMLYVYTIVSDMCLKYFVISAIHFNIILPHTKYFFFYQTIPNAIAGYHTYGSVAATTGNAFYLFEDTIYRKIGIVLMSLHELVAFGLFAGPLFLMLEKSLNLDNTGYKGY
jgi:auxin influx carrier (AUX1 LAX family)